MKNQFKTKKEAIQFLASIEWLESHSEGKKFSSNRIYLLSSGEYSRPDYYPIRYKDGWAISITYFYYPDTLYAPKNGRMDEDSFIEKFLID